MKSKIGIIVRKYGKDKSQLVGILQDIQAEYNYLPKEELKKLSRVMDIPLSQIYSMATFFKAFSLERRGRHILSICLGTACHVRGSANMLDRVSTILSIPRGETTADNEYTLETVNCIGACALGPVLTLDGEYHGQMTPEKVDKLLASFKEKQ